MQRRAADGTARVGHVPGTVPGTCPHRRRWRGRARRVAVAAPNARASHVPWALSSPPAWAHAQPRGPGAKAAKHSAAAPCPPASARRPPLRRSPTGLGAPSRHWRALERVDFGSGPHPSSVLCRLRPSSSSFLVVPVLGRRSRHVVPRMENEREHRDEERSTMAADRARARGTRDDGRSTTDGETRRVADPKSTRSRLARTRCGFNGAPNVGPGRGANGSGRASLTTCFNGAPDIGPGRGGPSPDGLARLRSRFNGAPDIGPGRAMVNVAAVPSAATLQWSPRHRSGER
jgi:hypothetical protein